jgi:hypothetical protein
MDDRTFNELKLQATIVPKQGSWPKPEVAHWIRLHECANEARELVRQAFMRSLVSEIPTHSNARKRPLRINWRSGTQRRV